LNLPKCIILNIVNLDLVKGVFNLFFGKENDTDTDYSFAFHEKFLESKEKRKNLIKFLITDLKIDVNPENVIKLRKKDFIIRNNNLYRKDIISVDNSDKLLLLLNNSKSPRLIGLQNIGATCYMNATLQCLVNINEFTKYLLNKDNFSFIIENIEKCELLSSYCQLLLKLCCDEKVVNYYAPTKFKNILSLKNPLFEGIQANDSKDLIYFLLEHMNFELNTINLKINQNLQKMNSDTIINEMNQSDKIFMINSFISEYSSENNNIIPKLFYSLIENESVCNGCKIHKYN
jgi:ubiquitin C-terminal hydrolase